MSNPEAKPSVVGSSDKRATSDRATGSFIALLMLVAVALVGQRVIAVATGPLPPGPGEVAPQFSAARLDGEKDGILARKGEVVLLDFWATWCPPCVASMPHLNSVYEEFRDRGFVVLGVNQEPNRVEMVDAFMRANAFSFPTVIDPGDIAQRYGVYSFPTSFLVSRQGVICRVFRGPVTEDLLKREVEPVLKSGQASGC